VVGGKVGVVVVAVIVVRRVVVAVTRVVNADVEWPWSSCSQEW
jgi:hypothetical protein